MKYQRWMHKAARDLGRSLDEFNALSKLYTDPCPRCGQSVVHGWMSEYVCDGCKEKAKQVFETRNRERGYRIKYRDLRKQMAEVGRVIQEAKQLIHENNERTPRNSLLRD